MTRKSSTSSHDIEHLRDRVRLYVQVMLTIDFFAYVSDFVTPLLLDQLSPPNWSRWLQLMRWGVTGGLACVWLFTKYAKPQRISLTILESGVTLSLVLIYIHIGMGSMTGDNAVYGPMFAMFGISLLLVVRASLVPSSVLRTAAIGIFSVVSLFAFARQALDAFGPVAKDGLGFIGGAFVIATSVTSHVIYGLRRQVRQAMRLGQYELGRKLGEGGMGVVYQATHVMLRRPTAIKLLPIDKVGESTVARFEREVQQTSRLEHPNSVQIYDYGRTPDGQFYYAMEYLDGVTLEQLVHADGPVTPARVKMILLQAAGALAEAHAIGLVHRDVKPANIMLCERAQVPDTVKVLDFGLVKELDNPNADDGITQANAIIGTPHYLAPEAISSPDDVGPPSDVYALGAVGFFLLTGREVFPAKSVIEVCSKHLSEAPEPPSQVLGSEIDPDLESLILRCLAKDPAERPKDGGELANELERLELPGWTRSAARTWWHAWSGNHPAAPTRGPAQRTQLKVDFGDR
ncbi:MAG TPA: serine/threonine-protein kinase [Polyangiaceae bacterium]|nr:serine/threonine-protein kinase [Polyangiaceae bacterium]